MKNLLLVITMLLCIIVILAMVYSYSNNPTVVGMVGFTALVIVPTLYTIYLAQENKK